MHLKSGQIIPLRSLTLATPYVPFPSPTLFCLPCFYFLQFHYLTYVTLLYVASTHHRLRELHFNFRWPSFLPEQQQHWCVDIRRQTDAVAVDTMTKRTGIWWLDSSCWKLRFLKRSVRLRHDQSLRHIFMLCTSQSVPKWILSPRVTIGSHVTSIVCLHHNKFLHHNKSQRHNDWLRHNKSLHHNNH